MNPRTRRILTSSALAAAVLAAAGAFIVHRYVDLSGLHASPVHVTAVADAAAKIEQVENRFDYDGTYKAADYQRTAGHFDGVDVLSVTGETHWQTGVTLILRVPGNGHEEGYDGVTIKRATELICFRLNQGPDDDTRDDDIPCPGTPALPVPQNASLTGADDRIKAALTGIKPAEQPARTALGRLHLDPAVQITYATAPGLLGVALNASQYDCVLVQVTPDRTSTWRPSHTQLSPGELPCTADVAASDLFGKYPH
ncbi:hypothetical protein [Actinoplanes sp. NPDC051494]|uniref:hypothetical protein n=1 Tax=Actinoplanes sp. NPDC051494 TaxID=3363907 RepID=UPI00379CBAA6